MTDTAEIADLLHQQNDLLREQAERMLRQNALLDEINHSLSVLRTSINANHEYNDERATARFREISGHLDDVRNAVFNLR